MFSKYHYLSHSHNNASHSFIATINGEIAGMCSVLHFPHPKVKNLKKIHRLVIKPDFQGAGFGLIFLNEIANHYKKQGYRMSIVTSAPSLMFAMKKSDRWAMSRKGRLSTGSSNGSIHNKNKKGSSSNARITTSWEYR